MQSEAARFIARLTVGDGCWEWPGSRDKQGYGRFAVPRTPRVSNRWLPKLAHRIAYELFVGPIPDGLTIDHLCRNKGCVNPSHLEAVTQRVNNYRTPDFNGNKTHCPQGHEYATSGRAYRGGRYCRVCDRDRWRHERSSASTAFIESR